MDKETELSKYDWDSPDFDGEAFEKVYFPDGSFEAVRERGLVEVSDGKGNWRKALP